jgi:predicted DNA-binding transcriptional regulator AlpA
MAKQEPPTNESVRLLTREQVAELLGFSADCLQRWASQGRGPRFLRLSPREVR